MLVVVLAADLYVALMILFAVVVLKVVNVPTVTRVVAVAIHVVP